MNYAGCRGKAKLKHAAGTKYWGLDCLTTTSWRSLSGGTYVLSASNFEPGQRIEAVPRMIMKYVDEGSSRDGDGTIYFRFQSH